VHGFAPALTSFVGRAEAVAGVAGLLGERRLVTVTGPGGSGKSRLAAQVARQVGGRFADGVWLVELAAVRDPAQVPSVVAAVLGARERPEEPAVDGVARLLAGQQLLLVLDNCEHVVGAAAGLCAGLLPAADEVRVLATSREPLRVAGEARYRLGPLALPDLDDLSAAARAESVVLFADRAASADARFVLDDRAGPAVARLVTRLDGMPLAIELAAARVETLGVAQLLDRIDDWFDLLTVGDRVAPGRQRSLAATVAWSYQLLDDREQGVFRALSVFPGPFTLEGAQAVAGAGAGPAVLHLVDCSLLVPPRTDPDGRSRYVMLGTLRGYGSRLLAEAGEQEQAAAALAGYAVGVAGQAATGLATATGEQTAARWLDAEDATTRQALGWALDHDHDVALRLAVALAPWWQLRGRLAGEYPRLREIAGHAAPGSDLWCTAQSWLGWMAMNNADPRRALGHFTALRDAVAGRRPSGALADSLAGRSYALANQDRLDEAADEGRRALALARELGYPAGEAYALNSLAVTAYYAGDFGRVLGLLREPDQMSAGIPAWIGRELKNLLTSALTEAGDLAAAEHSCVAALARARDAGDLPWLARALVDMADLDLRAGRLDDAAQHLRESLQIAARTGDPVAALNGLDWCGYLCAAAGRVGEAVTVWAARTALLPQYGYTDPAMLAGRRREPLRQAREVLGEAGARMAEDRGSAMSPVTAAEYALLLTAPGRQPQAPPELAGLSARERELVTLVAQGHTNGQIAAQLYISVRTVSSHLDRIRDKTGARRRADLTRLALAAGLV